MTARHIYILPLLLLVSVLCGADTTSNGALTPDEYRAELDRLIAATSQLDSSGKPIPDALSHLPQSWRVHAGQQDFEILSEGLRRDVKRYEDDNGEEEALAIRRRLESLRREIDGFEKNPADVSASRSALNAILAGREFRSVQGPTWFDRLRQRILEWIFRILGNIIRKTSIPTIGRSLVYVLMGLALAALLWIAYRSLWQSRQMDEVVPRDLPVSAKEWTIWLAEARAAAAKGEWRDAIHLAYWAGISFLERQGFWKPDRARTPREYLRLLSSTSEQRDTLVSLTRIFELAWYAKRDASERTFSDTLAELEKLGCR